MPVMLWRLEQLNTHFCFDIAHRIFEQSKIGIIYNSWRNPANLRLFGQ
jgi:hypothetical protein